MKFEEILVEDDDNEAEETASEASASAGEEDITFLEVLETQRTSLANDVDDDEVSIVFEDTSSSQENSPDVKPSRSLKRICPEGTVGLQKKQKLETLKTTGEETNPAKPSELATNEKSIKPGIDVPTMPASTATTDGPEGTWLRDWLGLPKEEETTKEFRPISADEEEVEDGDAPEMEGSGLTPKQRARAMEKEKRKEAGESVKPTEQAEGKLPKGYILLPHMAESDSKLTRQCLDQMFDDDDSDTDDPIKKEAAETHSFGCVQIDQDVLREINTLESVKVEPVKNDDVLPSQLSSPNPSDDSIPNHNFTVGPLPDPSQQTKKLEKLCILDTRPHIMDSEEAENTNLKPLEENDHEKNKFLDQRPILRKSEHEDEDRSFWTHYYCTTCQWLLGGAEGLLQHNRHFEQIDLVTWLVESFKFSGSNEEGITR